jgi:plasmid stabilization system protein ParE
VRKYRVIVTPEAQAGIRESFLYIHQRSPLNAERWLKQLYAEIATLEQFPERCTYAREREYLEEELRQHVFKSHRLVFNIDNSSATVNVLYVRHASRRAVGDPEESS